MSKSSHSLLGILVRTCPLHRKSQRPLNNAFYPFQSAKQRQDPGWWRNCQSRSRHVAILSMNSRCRIARANPPAALRPALGLSLIDIGSSFGAAAQTKLEQYHLLESKAVDIEKEPDATLQNAQRIVLGPTVLHATRNRQLWDRNYINKFYKLLL